MKRKTILLYVLCSLLISTSMISCLKMRCGNNATAPSSISYIDWNSPNSVSAIKKTLYGVDDKKGDGYPHFDAEGRVVEVTGWIPKNMMEPNESEMEFELPRNCNTFYISDDSTMTYHGTVIHSALGVEFPTVPEVGESAQKCFVQKVVEGSRSRKKCIIKATIHLHYSGNNMSCQTVSPWLSINSPIDIQFVD